MKDFKKLSMYDENIETTTSNSTTPLLGLDNVSESTSPTEKEIIDIILEEVWIRGIDLDDYRNYFEEPRASIKRRLDELYSR